MKKIRTIALLLIGLSLNTFAQTIPAVKSTVSTTTHIITFVDGVVVPLVGSNTIKTRAAAYLKAVKPPVVIPPVTTDYKSFFDRVALFTSALNRDGKPAKNGDFVTSISYGENSLKVSSLDVPRTETMKYTNGYVNIDNENKFYLVSPERQINWGSEVWFTGIDLSAFPYESYMNIYGMYLGEYGGNLRSTNGNTPDAMFIGAKLPTYKPFAVRMQYTTNKTLKLWIDGVYYGEKNTYLTGTTGKNLTRFGIGTDTNNAKWFCSSVLQVNHVLTDDQANKAFAELSKVQFNYPFIKNVGVSIMNGTVTATGNYYSPTGAKEASRIYRWYSAGNGSGPDVTANKLMPGLTTGSFKASDYKNMWVRVDIECTDVNGVTFGGASGCAYYRIQ